MCFPRLKKKKLKNNQNKAENNILKADLSAHKIFDTPKSSPDKNGQNSGVLCTYLNNQKIIFCANCID